MSWWVGEAQCQWSYQLQSSLLQTLLGCSRRGGVQSLSMLSACHLMPFLGRPFCQTNNAVVTDLRSLLQIYTWSCLYEHHKCSGFSLCTSSDCQLSSSTLQCLTAGQVFILTLRNVIPIGYFEHAARQSGPGLLCGNKFHAIQHLVRTSRTILIA